MGVQGTRPPRTRNLVELASIAAMELGEHELEALAELTPYYVVARYPNAGLRRPWREIRRGTAERFVRLAEKLVARVRESLETLTGATGPR